MTQMRTIESVPFAKELAAALAMPGTDPMRVAEDFSAWPTCSRRTLVSRVQRPTRRGRSQISKGLPPARSLRT